MRRNTFACFLGISCMVLLREKDMTRRRVVPSLSLLVNAGRIGLNLARPHVKTCKNIEISSDWEFCFMFLGSWTYPLAYSRAPTPANRMSQEKSNTLQNPISRHHIQTLVLCFNCIFLVYHFTFIFFAKFHVSKNQDRATICVQFRKLRLLTRWKKINLFKNSFYISVFPFHPLASKSV